MIKQPTFEIAPRLITNWFDMRPYEKNEVIPSYSCCSFNAYPVGRLYLSDAMTGKNSSLPEYKNIPGVYLGTFHGTKSSSVDLFGKIGKGVAISAAYLNWSSGFNNGLLLANANVGQISISIT